MNKIYLIKNLAPWMMDELKAFSKNCNFTVIFLRNQKDFYKEDIEKLVDNGIMILSKPFNQNFFPQKLSFTILFFLKNFNKFWGGYNSAIGFKSLGWFLRLDLSLFKGNSSIHAQFATQTAILSLMLKEFFNNSSNDIEYSFTFHAHDIYFKNKWFTYLVNNSKQAFSISQFNIHYVKEKYQNLKPDKIVLSRLGVFRPNNIKVKKNSKKQIRIGLISWFVEKKGIKYLLEAMKKLNNEKIKLILAGDGPLKIEILDNIKDNNLENCIEYIGKVKGKQKFSFFEDLDGFILPAITVPNDMDGIPVVLMEAISYGLPLISTKVSGIPEICIDNFNGFLVEEKNSMQITEAILRLFREKETYTFFSSNSIIKSNDYDLLINSEGKLKYLNWID